MRKQNNNRPMDIICGRNSVLELLKAGKRTINKITISKTARGSVISEIISLAKQKGAIVCNVPPENFDQFSKNSQGIAAEVSSVEYVCLMDLIEKSKKSLKPFLVLLDGIENPHNLGAIIRNCVAFGAVGVIIPKRRSVGVNSAVSKSSSGAVEHIAVSRVSNINQAIDFLKKHGFWIAGAENSGQTLEEANLLFPLALVVGSEGFGLGDLTKKNCDFLISIPQKNTISSLNVSCASAIILYEISKISDK